MQNTSDTTLPETADGAILLEHLRSYGMETHHH